MVVQIRLTIYVCIVDLFPQEHVWISCLANPFPTHHNHNDMANTIVRALKRKNLGVVDGMEAVSLEEWSGTNCYQHQCSSSILSNDWCKGSSLPVVVDGYYLVWVA